MQIALVLAAGAPTPAETPLWASIPAAFNSVITSAAIIVGAAFAYVRFIRGRVLRASCEPEVEATEVLMPDQTRALSITATIKNNGNYRLAFPVDTEQTLSISRADADLWRKACVKRPTEVEWTKATFHHEDLLTIENNKDYTVVLEPGGRVRRHVLVPVPTNRCVSHNGPAAACFGYKVQMVIEAAPVMMFRKRKAVPYRTEQIVRT
jgi:hypothetical protein